MLNQINEGTGKDILEAFGGTYPAEARAASGERITDATYQDILTAIETLVASGGGGSIPTVATGLTATGSDQAGALLLAANVNVISSVPNGTGVRLPTIWALGVPLTIIDNTANELLIYPPSGAAIDQKAANASLALEDAGGVSGLPKAIVFVKVSSTLWVTQSAATLAILAWVAQTITSRNYNDVIYALSLFVAVADEGIMTSPDGITWTSRSTAAAPKSVAFGNGVFVAVGENSGESHAVFTSPDGITWTEVSNPAERWDCVRFGNGLFVACSTNGTTIFTSPDGVTWTQRVKPNSTVQRGLAYGAGKWVIMGDDGEGGPLLITSADAITWTAPVSQPTSPGRFLIFANNTFVSCYSGSTSGIISHSTDGLTWTDVDTGFAHLLQAVAYGNGVWMITSATGVGHRAIRSEDLATWIATVTVQDNAWRAVAFGVNKFVALATSGSIRAMTYGPVT